MNAYNVTRKENDELVSTVIAESASEARKTIAEKAGIDAKALVATKRPVVDSPITKMFLAV